GMLYMRFEAIWFMNIIELFNVLHCFCLCYRKRAKQARRDKKIEEKVRAEVTAEQNSSQQQPVLQPQQQQQQQVMKKQDAANLGVVSRTGPAPGPRTLKDERNQQTMEMSTRPPPRYSQPPPVPGVVYRNPSTAPPESRPYSYLNPGFRPTDSNDVNGMKRHGVPSHPGLVNEGYLRDEDPHMHRPLSSRRRSLDDLPDDNGYLSDSPLNHGNRQYRPPAGPAGMKRNQSFRPAPGDSYQSDHGERQRPARYNQRQNTTAPTPDYDQPWNANSRSSNLRKLPPALPRVLPTGPPPPPLRGPDHPRSRDSVYSRPNRQPYEYY
ncbi:unnamed protein product, partial [Meganyctiphanes norvegica]